MNDEDRIIPSNESDSDYESYHDQTLNIKEMRKITQMAQEAFRSVKPVRSPLWCPYCGVRHVDRGEWKDKLHHKHLCIDGCMKIFRLEEYISGIE